MNRMLIGCAALAVLSACSGTELRRSVGFDRNSPDEFQVVSRPPLSVPPIYHLRPPSEGQTGVVPADKRAESLVFQGKELPEYEIGADPAFMPETAVTEVSSGSLGSTGEETLLQNAGAPGAKQDIRKTLDEENRPVMVEEKKEKEKGFFGKLKDKVTPGKGEPTVDAKREQERIRANKKDGKKVNEGETPVIDPKEESVLDKILK